MSSSNNGLADFVIILLYTQRGPVHQIAAINIKTRQPKQKTIANFLFTHIANMERCR